MRMSLPVMKPPSGPMSSAPTDPTSSGVPARPATDSSIMRRYPSPRGPVSSSLASGVMMMPGLIALIRAPRLPQRTASAIARSEFPRFEIRAGGPEDQLAYRPTQPGDVVLDLPRGGHDRR